MQTDYLVVFGSLAVLVSLPALLNAFSRGDPPRVWGVLAIAGFGMLAAGFGSAGSGYTYDDLPDAYGRVFAGLVN